MAENLIHYEGIFKHKKLLQLHAICFHDTLTLLNLPSIFSQILEHESVKDEAH